MSGVTLCEVQPGKSELRISEFFPSWEFAHKDTPIEPREVTIPITCAEGNSLHAGLYKGTLYFWVDPHVSPTDSDRDRWAALTGEYPSW